MSSQTEISEIAGRRTDRLMRLLSRQAEEQKSICLDRAKLFTESMKKTEGMHQMLRVALAFKHVLEHVDLSIRDDELILGSVSSKPGAGPYFPEFGASEDLIKTEIMSYAGADAILEYWNGRTVRDLWLSICPEEAQAESARGTFLNSMAFKGLGHISVDYTKVLKHGFGGLLAEVERRAAALTYDDPEDLNRAVFYRAAVIVLQGVIIFAKRHSEAAFALAKTEPNATRRAELLAAAEACAHVATNPPRTFHEALQAFWFLHLLIQIEVNGHSISPGRFDQYMYPYYSRDIAEARITRDDAADLLDSLWVKFAEVRKLYSWDELGLSGQERYGGVQQNVVIGGLTPDGRDASNELSYLLIETTARVREIEPSLSIRVHDGTPDKLLAAACDLAKLGTGQPHFFNDKSIVTALLAKGISLRDARNWAPVGCEEIRTSGRDLGILTGIKVNPLRCLELAVLDESKSYTSFSDVFSAYKEKVAYAVSQMVVSANAAELAHRSLAPMPFISLFVDDCLDRGQPLTEGGAIYNWTACKSVGVANIADGLAAIKRLVFDEGAVTMEELRSAMRNNFSGESGEHLRNVLLERAPKYGNDDDEVDNLAKVVSAHLVEEVTQHRNPRGGRFQTGLYSVSSNTKLGALCGATPDGRLAGQPTADNLSPAHGRDRKGPTAVINSVNKIDHLTATEATALTLNFNPTVLEGRRGTEVLMAFVRSHFDQMGNHVQFNVVSTKTLRDAQRFPEKYRYLTVRVGGFSAKFTQLDRQAQEDIIARTEQSL